jgi:NAD(P)-dependent dehydrogenase (short-subunit alcohol dehydrogenase family)
MTVERPGPSSDPLEGKVVVVVGGSSGIGLAIATAARDRGADVVVASRAPERAAEALSGMRTVALDVTDGEAVEAAFAEIGELDHLVCTAASGFPPGLFRAPESEVRALMESKFWGQYRCSRAAAPRLRPGGSITLTSGIRSRRPLPGSGAFTAVNMAVEGMARGLALEIGPIRVNVISPGVIDTPVFSGFTPEARASHLEKAAKQSTVGRHGYPEDVAELTLAVMSNGFMSGAVLDIDGGALLK